ncbi:MAG: DUF501 domain-containing protein [Geodermatophilaceae bacterium]|nr:DUF501 domain-containing protein [Geodermatophilaceae bacterium]MDQ3477308.1 DUF501 domain-containing protein [Actinomycetota bacterium]
MNQPAQPPQRRPAQAADRAIVAAQLGRAPRAMRAVAHRCDCGLPDVVQTDPQLADGTPFPTLYYLTCPRAAAAVSRLEAAGVMREMTERLATDNDLRTAYRWAHESYLRDRDALGELDSDASAGGMPERVKCLHALVAHALAVGPGVNPLGDEALAEIPPWWRNGPCVSAEHEGSESHVAAPAGGDDSG